MLVYHDWQNCVVLYRTLDSLFPHETKNEQVASSIFLKENYQRWLLIVDTR